MNEFQHDSEKRKFDRKPLNVDVRLTPLSIETSGVKLRQTVSPAIGSTSDISAGGARINALVDPDKFAYMLVELPVESGFLPRYIMGQTRWQPANSIGDYGITFLTKNQMKHVFGDRSLDALPKDIFKFNSEKQEELDGYLRHLKEPV